MTRCFKTQRTMEVEYVLGDARFIFIHRKQDTLSTPDCGTLDPFEATPEMLVPK